MQAPLFSQSYNRYTYCLNNPLKYIDEDGEFWTLVIGAAIGGLANLIGQAIAGNVSNFGQGLAAFGVGAAAGALGAGVGAGISSAMAGGGFGAGFIGSSAAKSAASSFVSGAAIGGGGGLAGGFTTGFGNALIGGKNFGQALGSGLKGGLLGGASGAIGGGLWGGINAVRDGRTFWGGRQWETTFDFYLPNGDLPIHLQIDPTVGCTQAVIQSFHEYFSGQIINLDASQGADFTQLVNQLREDGVINFSSRRVHPDIKAVGRALTMGQPAAITYNIHSASPHVVGLNRIKIQQVPRLFGSGFRTRTIMQVMDPLQSSFRNLPLSLFRNGIIRLAIPH